MIIFSCSNISKSFGLDKVLEDVSFHIQDKERVGLVGVNGAGKSTLFKIIVGEVVPDSGELYLSRDVTIGYMAQNYIVDSEKSIWDELLEIFAPLIEMEQEIKALEHEMEKTAPGPELNRLIRQHAELCELFKEKNGYGYTSHIRAVLMGLGFKDEQFVLPIKHLSGGQKTRVALAKLLLQNPRLLLLDEPTNHLDIESIEWLENFLSSYSGSVFIISHDRFFLDKVVNKIIELEKGKSTVYMGNYSFYVKRKEELRQQQWKEYTLQEKEIARIQAIIEQQRRWNRERNIRAAESREKSLEKMKRVEKPGELPEPIRFTFETRIKSGNDVLSVENLSKSYGNNHLFHNIEFSIRKGDRVFLLGGNGTGKTTLFKILLNKVDCDSGTIRWGTNVVPGYYDQEQSDIDIDNTVIDEVWDANPEMTQTEIRNALAAFLFQGDDVFKTISTLSGGEKGRVALVKLMLSKANLLILDEPTNHLDIPSREALENALSDYEGTLFVISHDRYFINKIATRIFELTPNGIIEYLGNYDYYAEKKRQKSMSAGQNVEKKQSSRGEEDSSGKQEYLRQKEKKANERRIQRRISMIEEEIYNCENEIEDMEQQLCSPEIYSDHEKVLELTNKISELKEKLGELYNEWEELQELQEA
ncbi:MAG: ABC-F type ribosomal protection protein [Clostridiaceae bacterium]|nr:ABC-F type ribosomal protection protein [Clostridiaceae bacterium]